MATKVKLRQKAISENRQSLYLDFYPPILNQKTGKYTRREFLGYYIFDRPKNPIDKQHNKETLQLAQQIRQMRESELNKPDIYNEYEKELLKTKEFGERNFVEYFKELADKRTGSNQSSWTSSYYYLHTFTDGFLRIADLNEKVCNDFKGYLLSANSRRSSERQLSQNSALAYFNKFKAALKNAFRDGLLQQDLNGKIRPIPEQETIREYLTLDELNELVKTHCKDNILKSAALFSALTGLRFSDIEKLEWKEVIIGEKANYSVKFRQKKTKGIEMHPISEQAFKLMGKKQGLNDKVFEGLKYSAYHNSFLREWVDKAGITKKITFHCFRHTYAVLQLERGTDIYVLSKLLGHREIRTTQIYAKVVDSKKREAADRIKLDLIF